MATLVCDICGGKLIIGAGGIAVCDSCGLEHGSDRMKEKIQEVKGTVRVDNSHMIDNYLTMAKNAQDGGNNKEAEEYCNKIIEIDVDNYQAWLIKGKAVGWQSTLANKRIAETINAFSTALENCPEQEHDELAASCADDLHELHTALLSARVGNFKTHPSQSDLTGLQGDVQDILVNTANFLLKAKAPADAFHLQYGRTINNGICHAWVLVQNDFRGTENYPTDYDLTRFIEEGDILTGALNVALALCSDSEDKEMMDLLIQIHENLIYFNTAIKDAQSYDVSFDGGFKHYNKSKSLVPDAKAARQKIIDESKMKIEALKSVGEKAAKEAAEKRLQEYWDAHTEEKANLESENASLQEQVDALNAEIAKIPGSDECKQLNARVQALSDEKSALGLFKLKEKKAVQEKIDAVNASLKVVTDRMDAAKAVIDKKIAPLSNRIGEIKIELTKER